MCKERKARYGGSVPAAEPQRKGSRGKENVKPKFKIIIPGREFMSYQLFEDLVVWKRSARLSSDVYKELRELKRFWF